MKRGLIPTRGESSKFFQDEGRMIFEQQFLSIYAKEMKTFHVAINHSLGRADV